MIVVALSAALTISIAFATPQPPTTACERRCKADRHVCQDAGDVGDHSNTSRICERIYDDCIADCRAGTSPPVSAPAAPGPIVFPDKGDTRLTIRWSYSKYPMIDGFKLYRRRGGDPWLRIAVVDTPPTRGRPLVHRAAATHVDEGLSPGSRYCYRVTAYNEGGSASSEPACASTRRPRLPEEPTTRVLEFLEDGTVGGRVGLYLKQIGGPLLAEHNAEFRFEPASALKALIHFHAIRQLQEGTEINDELVTLDRQIPWFTELLGSDEPPGGCPALTGAASDTLEEGLHAMMWDSDNRWAQAMRDFFSDPSIDATRRDLGMRATKLSHVIGCFESKPEGHTNASEDPNELTLVDAGSMYEGVATGFLTPLWRRQAYELMSTENTRFDTVIDQEANGMGLSHAALADFKDARDAALKTGAYRKPNLDPPQQHRAVAGWAEIPWKDTDCGLVAREYVYGAFIHGAEELPERFQSSIRDAGVELFREQIRAALESWVACEAD